MDHLNNNRWLSLSKILYPLLLEFVTFNDENGETRFYNWLKKTKGTYIRTHITGDGIDAKSMAIYFAKTCSDWITLKESESTGLPQLEGSETLLFAQSGPESESQSLMQLQSQSQSYSQITCLPSSPNEILNETFIPDTQSDTGLTRVVFAYSKCRLMITKLENELEILSESLKNLDDSRRKILSAKEQTIQKIKRLQMEEEFLFHETRPEALLDFIVAELQ
jgi:hypothetical protein